MYDKMVTSYTRGYMMKKGILLIAMLSFLGASEDGYKLIKVVEGATLSNASKEIDIPEEQRPAGFIIKEAKDGQENLVVLNDSDGDGVADAKDKCPDTPKGKVVDSDGCTKVVRLHVNFDFDKYELKEEYKDEINQAVKFVEENPKLSISVDGHTDADGTEAYNQILSEKRATRVTLELVAKGVLKEKIQSQGHGELKPLVPNDTALNKAKNRRVDISFDKEEI